MSVLSRSSVVILIPVLTICALIGLGGGDRPFLSSARARLRPAALFLSTSILLLVPWTARNYLALDRLVVGTTLAGYNLYRHNSSLLTDDYLRYVGPEEGARAVEALLARRRDLKGTENEAQMDAVYREEALRIISAAPIRYLRLSGACC